jgi:pyruvate/2-oxoglutarate/acetoin dehydrogenase E1 component
MMRKMRYLQAVAEGLRQEMERDPAVFVMGEDVTQGLRGITKGLVERFGPERVIDTPISESGFTGIGTGASLLGMRPVLEYQISEFVFVAFDQLVDQAQKLRYMSGGKLCVPVTYLIAGSGARGGMAGQHSDNPYPYILHGGIKTVVPATPRDAKGLVVSAIRENDPVAVFLPVNSMRTRGEVPEEEYTVPLGKGELRRVGKDITVVAVGHMVDTAIGVAEKLESDGVSLEIFDPRSLLPLDRELLKQSVKKTGRVIVLDDSNRTCGFAAEIASFVSEECFEYLKAPVKRVTRADVPVPFSESLESCVLPDEKKLFSAVHKIMASN